MTSPSEPTHRVSLANTFLLTLGICGYNLHNKQEFGGSTGFLSFLGMIAPLPVSSPSPLPTSFG